MRHDQTRKTGKTILPLATNLNNLINISERRNEKGRYKKSTTQRTNHEGIPQEKANTQDILQGKHLVVE